MATSLEKVFENQHKYKSIYFFSQSFFDKPIIPNYTLDKMEAHFETTASEVTKKNNNWGKAQHKYVVQGTNEILALYENKN